MIVAKSLCVWKRGTPSVLLVPMADNNERLKTFACEEILKELKVPFILDVLTAVAVPSTRTIDGKEVPPICTAYSILINQRWNELSLLQLGSQLRRLIHSMLQWIILYSK